MSIRFTIPTFMSGNLPSDGSPVTEDITLIGTDGTKVVVKANSQTIYNEKSTKYFEAKMDETKILYQFTFPFNTLNNSNSTQFTTPSESVYIFSNNDGTHLTGGKTIKNVSKGTIEIKPPNSKTADSLTDSVANIPKAVESQVTTFIDNTSLLEASIGGELSKLGLLKNSPFRAMGMIVYKLLMDMIVVIIFWALFVSISCWLTVPSKLMYPTDVDKYPFVFYNTKKVGETYYDIQKQENDQLCKHISPDDIEKNRQKQGDFIKYVNSLEDKQKGVLKAVKPNIMDPSEKGGETMSAKILEQCAKTELCTMDYITYFVRILVFHNYLYCGKVLEKLHVGCSFFSNNVMGSLGPKITVVAFAALLYYLYLSVGELNRKVRKKLKIKLQPEIDAKSILINQMINLFVSILSCCLSIIIPLCSILVITSLLTTAYVLAKSCLFPTNGSMTIMVISFLTFFFSLSQYVYIIQKITSGTNVFNLVEKMYVKEFSIRTLFSFLGITVPIVFGLGYGSYIGFKLFFSFFKLLKEPGVSEVIKNTAGSVVLVGLMLLLLHVKQILGKTYSVMTFFIIILVGIYVLTKK